jgi:hypothetical protein
MSERIRQRCLVVSYSDIPSDATIIIGPLLLDGGNNDFLCGDCNACIIRGFSLVKLSHYLTDKTGCFVTCQECAAHNQVTAPRIP